MDDMAIAARYSFSLAEAIAAIRFRQMMERFCEDHPEICHGVIDDNPFKIGPDPGPIMASAVVALLGTVGFPDPDGNDPDPKGPLGPVMRDVLVAMSIVQLGSSITDRETATQVRKFAADVVQRQAAKLQEVVAQY